MGTFNMIKRVSVVQGKLLGTRVCEAGLCWKEHPSGEQSEPQSGFDFLSEGCWAPTGHFPELATYGQ